MIDVALLLWSNLRMNVRSRPISNNVKNLQGQRFGRWTVTGYLGVDDRGYSVWECRCDCGVSKSCGSEALKKGRTKSCGCFKQDKFLARITKHGHSSTTFKSPEYIAWTNMVARCKRKNHPQYHLYGGRGITVCDRWLKFENFFADVGSRPTPRHSIHRTENNSGYEQENVKWATWDEQQNAKRTNHEITFGGQTMNLMQWAKKIGVHYVTLHYRLKRGWTIERALTTPLQKRT